MMWSKNSRHHVPLPQQQFNKIASPGDTQKSVTFLPMLCSSSTKQVKLSHRRCASSSSSSSTITDEPSSPKVGCMGQVKRNNKVVGFPSIISFTSSTTSNSSSNSSSVNNNISSTHHHHHAIKCHDQNNYYYTSNSIVKYHKIKRFFSAKSSPTSVIAAARTTVGGQGGSQKGRNGRRNVGCRSMVDESKSCNNNNHRNRNIVKDDCDKGSLVNLVDMDPPLPVVKRVVQQQQENDGEKMGTLWKRRSGGAPLKTLRVQVIDPNNLSVNPVSTV